LASITSVNTVSEPRRSATRLTRNSKLFKTIIKAIQEKKGSRIVSLDLRKIEEASADFFIICEATSSVQVKAIADNIDEVVKQEVDERPYRSEGLQSLKWVLIDYVNVVVHIMQPEARTFYQLEEMWHDAPSAEHEG
jgi:ribosome-associated protein